MKNLSKEKRNQLVLVIILTLAVLAGMWLGLINFQKQALQSITERKETAERELKRRKLAIENADRIEVELAESGKTLAKLEEGMASGDLYFWAINTIRQFKLAHKVEIPQYSQIDGPRDMTLLPKFPYKQATLSIGGTAYFHDFGRFVADFENQFPYIRILNLTLEPLASMVNADKERLSFKMDVVALVKPPNPS